MGRHKQREGDPHCLFCEQPILQRGLCKLHYGRFRRRKESLPPEQREDFDKLTVSKGLILDDGRNVDDPFAEVLQQFITEQEEKHEKEVKDHFDGRGNRSAQDEDKLVDEAKTAVAKRKGRKKGDEEK